MKIICTPDKSLNKANALLPDTIGVNLYEHRDGKAAGLGRKLISAVEKWDSQPTQEAWDFLSISLGVIAADTFIKREAAEDGWTREIDLTVSVFHPAPWQSLVASIEQTLRFLSGDRWKVTITGGGLPVPTIKQPKLITEDCVCLFSGGLDSLIGSIDLIDQGHSPFLVSHAYPKDREKQAHLAPLVLANNLSHFIENVHPQWNGDNETSMRARSILFLGMGVLIASGLTTAEKVLYVPENGFISLNIPLTTRRIASLSTKTTHPFFISSIQGILTNADIPVTINNPYKFMTKGEMMEGCRDKLLLDKISDASVSCGKWKRANKQCGKCVPCIIRRAAFQKAGLTDRTLYSNPYLDRTLMISSPHEVDDIKSIQFAIGKSKSEDIKRWVLRSAPLGFSEDIQNSYVDVFRRGLIEIENFLP
jgi:hypothetical protein